MSEEQPCFVYAIGLRKAGRVCGPVKIGISSNPMARVRELQTASPYKLVLLAMLMAPSRDVARGAEEWFHFCHPDRRLEGEWFDLEPFSAVGSLGFFVSDHFDNALVGGGKRAEEQL